jgi:uncharacterized protein with FMN-binding domain
MRRVMIAVAGTIAGLYGLLSYKTGAPPSRLATGSPTTVTTPSTAPPSAPSTRTTRSAPTTTARRVVDGATETNRFGDVQVRLVMQNGQITDVQALVLPSDRQRSARISDIAGPRLRIEVLDAQSASIDVVSGATYTSKSYAQSVQSALDRAR